MYPNYIIDFVRVKEVMKNALNEVYLILIFSVLCVPDCWGIVGLYNVYREREKWKYALDRPTLQRFIQGLFRHFQHTHKWS